MGSNPNLRPEGSSQAAEPMAEKPRHAQIHNAQTHNTPGNHGGLTKDALVNLVKIIELVPLAPLKPWHRDALINARTFQGQLAGSTSGSCGQSTLVSLARACPRH